MTTTETKTTTNKPTSKAAQKNTQKPVKVFRQGAIAASIWKRLSPSGFEYYDFSISRSWKTKTGKEGYSSSFFAKNGPELGIVIQDTTTWIAQQQLANPFEQQVHVPKSEHNSEQKTEEATEVVDA